MLPIDKMIITQTFTMARWQIVVERSEATKQRPKQQQQNKKQNKQKQQQQNACSTSKVGSLLNHRTVSFEARHSKAAFHFLCL